MYCTFNFESFPFDSNYCGFEYFASDTDLYLLLNSSTLVYKGENIKNQDKIIHVNQTRFPFDISLEVIEPFFMHLTGNNYSATGMRVHFTRNKLSALIGSYYAPTFVFVLLSLVSYSIEADMVRYYLIQLKLSCKILNIHKIYPGTWPYGIIGNLRFDCYKCLQLC